MLHLEESQSVCFWECFPLMDCIYRINILEGLGLQKLRQSTKISGDAAVAVVLVSGLAVGVILVSSSGGFSVDLFSFLFGSILLISNEDTMMILAISAGIIATLVVMQKQFLHLTFNEEQAKIAGLPVTLLNYAFVILASITVVTSMRLVGILLISALIVIPNIAAMMFGKGIQKDSRNIHVNFRHICGKWNSFVILLQCCTIRNNSHGCSCNSHRSTCCKICWTDIKNRHKETTRNNS